MPDGARRLASRSLLSGARKSAGKQPCNIRKKPEACFSGYAKASDSCRIVADPGTRMLCFMLQKDFLGLPIMLTTSMYNDNDDDDDANTDYNGND
eukprot:scaffold163307_cov22-Prasinocladus_malaysianus.AAC.2